MGIAVRFDRCGHDRELFHVNVDPQQEPRPRTELPPGLPPENAPGGRSPPGSGGLAGTAGHRRLLDEVRRLQARQHWLEGALYACSALALLLTAGGFAAHASPSLGRWLLILAPVVAALLACYFGIYQSVRRLGDDLRTARWVDGRVPSLRRGLLAA